MPETLHAQAVASDERVAFSVVVPGCRLPFAASIRRFATVVVVESEDVCLAVFTVCSGVKPGTSFRTRRKGAHTEFAKFGARMWW